MKVRPFSGLGYAVAGPAVGRVAATFSRMATPGTIEEAPTPPASGLTPTEFDSAVTAITHAFGDPTRRAIYLYVHEHPDGVRAAAVARHFDLHPNVARHHLDKLAAGGHLDVAAARPSGGAGRPSKVFRPVAPKIDLSVAVGHDTVLIRLLGKTLEALGPERSNELATEVGREFGATLAAEMGAGVAGSSSFRASLHAVADALASHGFGAHAEDMDGSAQIVTQHCPFGDVALQNPVLCAVDHGMVEGLLGTLYPGEISVEVRSTRPRGDAVCVTDIDGETPGR